MLSLKDCLDFCDLDYREIEAIAAHEHIPVIVAAELSNSLLDSVEGLCNLHRMMREDIEQALDAGELDRATQLTATYLHLKATHPLPEDMVA